MHRGERRSSGFVQVKADVQELSLLALLEELQAVYEAADQPLDFISWAKNPDGTPTELKVFLGSSRWPEWPL